LCYKVVCGSFDRVTDTAWFNDMTVGSATSVSQLHTHTHPIPGPVPCYRKLLCLERSTLILNKLQFFTYSLHQLTTTTLISQHNQYVCTVSLTYHLEILVFNYPHLDIVLLGMHMHIIPDAMKTNAHNTRQSCCIYSGTPPYGHPKSHNAHTISGPE